MFDGFDNASDVLRPRRYAVSSAAALGLCAALGVLVVTVGGREELEKAAKKLVDVRFRPPPPPPAPIPPAPLPVRVAKVKPAVKADVTPSPVAAAPAPLVAPVAMPNQAPQEADAANAVAAITVASGGTGNGRGNGSGGGSGPIQLPENAQAPVPLSSNIDPDYPAEARAAGKEGLVILKIVVDVDGSVAAVTPMKGDEPFLSAALRAVGAWKFKPALVEGQATAVYRIIKLPFRIRA